MATVDVTLPKGVEVDLYADPNVIAAGITTATAINVQNKGNSIVKATDQADFTTGSRDIEPKQYLANSAGDGFLCLSQSNDGLVSVGELS